MMAAIRGRLTDGDGFFTQRHSVQKVGLDPLRHALTTDTVLPTTLQSIVFITSQSSGIKHQ